MTATYLEAERRVKEEQKSRSASTRLVNAGASCSDEDAQLSRSKRQRKAYRRRQIDPTTCERDYSVEEIEFMQALDAYKRTSGRMFPTCSEILEVLRTLGYVRIAADAEVATV